MLSLETFEVVDYSIELKRRDKTVFVCKHLSNFGKQLREFWLRCFPKLPPKVASVNPALETFLIIKI
jgi:hypothetical protein